MIRLRLWHGLSFISYHNAPSCKKKNSIPGISGDFKNIFTIAADLKLNFGPQCLCNHRPWGLHCLKTWICITMTHAIFDTFSPLYCNQGLSPLKLESRSWCGVLNTTLCDKVCQWLVAGRWFSSGTPVSSTNKTDYGITEIFVESDVKHPNPILQSMLIFVS